MTNQSIVRYSDETREAAVKLYLNERNYASVGRMLGIHRNIIQQWGAQEWFIEALGELEREQAAKLSGELRETALQAMNVTKKRLSEGDAFFNKKTGEWEKKPVSAKDAANITTKFLETTLKVEKPLREIQLQKETKNSLDKLAETFSKFAKEIKEAQKPKIQVTDVITVKET